MNSKNKNKNYYCIINNEPELIYSKIYKLERFKLKDLLEKNGIKYTNNHQAYYLYFLENINLKEYRKSNKTTAEEIFVSSKQVARMKKNFIQVGILKKIKLGKTNGETDTLKFNRLIKIEVKYINNENKATPQEGNILYPTQSNNKTKGKTLCPTPLDIKSNQGETSCPTKINKYKINKEISSNDTIYKYNNKDKSYQTNTTDLENLKKKYYKYNYDPLQAKKQFLKYDYAYLKLILEVLNYLWLYQRTEIKDKNTGRFLYIALENETFASKYVEKYVKFLDKKEQEGKRQKYKKDYNKYIRLLIDDELKQLSEKQIKSLKKRAEGYNIDIFELYESYVKKPSLDEYIKQVAL